MASIKNPPDLTYLPFSLPKDALPQKTIFKDRFIRLVHRILQTLCIEEPTVSAHKKPSISNRTITPTKPLHVLPLFSVFTENTPACDIENPSSIRNLNTIRKLHYYSAINMIALQYNRGLIPEDASVWQLHTGLLADITELDADTQARGDATASKKELKQTRQLSKKLKYRLLQHLPDKEQIKTYYDLFYTEQLHTRPWHNIIKKIIVHGEHIATSKQIPACNMRSLGRQTGRCIFGADYENSGISSKASQTPHHMVNGWATQLTDAKDNLRFQGIRHGVHALFNKNNACDDSQTNENAALVKQINKEKAKESLLAAIWLKSQEELEHAMQDPTHIIEIKLTSSSLLTPGILPLSPENETHMLQQQTEAFRSISSDEQKNKGYITLKVSDAHGQIKPIKVKAEILTFNFGCNQLAQHPALSNTFGGWNVVNTLNETELTKLVGNLKEPKTTGGWVQEYLDKINQMEQALASGEELDESTKLHYTQIIANKSIIKQLSEQIKHIWFDRNLLTRGRYRYTHGEFLQMTTRIVWLSYLLDAIPLFNCKSGKDRTGIQDVEVKYLIEKTLNSNGIVPKPETPLLDKDKELYEAFLFNGGNFEVQNYASGVHGYKIFNPRGLLHRIKGCKDALIKVKQMSGIE